MMTSQCLETARDTSSSSSFFFSLSLLSSTSSDSILMSSHLNLILGSIFGALVVIYVYHLIQIVITRQTTSISSWRVGIAVIIFCGYSILISAFHVPLWIVIVTLPVVISLIFLILRVLLASFPSTMHSTNAPESSKNDNGLKRYRFVAMPISHFCEKARWCMDLIDVPYEELNVGGILSLFFRSRTVPWLVDYSSNSLIGNSDEILMYLSAVHVPILKGSKKHLAQQLFLRNEETIAWEDELNRFGHAFQGWAYHYLLHPRVISDYTLRAWGGYESKVSFVERWFLYFIHPFFRKFLTVGLALQDPVAQEKRHKIILALLEKVDVYFQENPSNSYLTGDHLSYIDITFCSLAAPLLYFTLVTSSTKSLYAKNRFSSFVIQNPEYYQELKKNYPLELIEFEKNLLSRPCGKYIKRMYEEHRWQVFQ